MGIGSRVAQEADSSASSGQLARTSSSDPAESPQPRLSRRLIRRPVSSKHDLPSRPSSAASSYFPLHTNTSSSTGVGSDKSVDRPKYVPIEISPSLIQSVLRDSSQSLLSPEFERRPSLPILEGLEGHLEARRPFKRSKHVPILIPRFAHPFAESSSDSLGELGTATSSKSPPHTVCSAFPRSGDLRSPPAESESLSQTRPCSSQPLNTQAMATLRTNNSQTSLGREAGHDLQQREGFQNGQSDNPMGPQQGSRVSPTVNQHGPAGTIAGTSGPTNLPGLVCNVHRTTGKEPHALVGATTTILGDKLYVFGGRVLSRTRPQLTSDMYELDLIRRHWTRLETTGDIPPPRYFHSVCALGDSKLVCYGGMSPVTPSSTSASASSQQAADPQPEVVVMSDIHVFDVPTRHWTAIPTTETPQGRYAHCATILPSSAVFASANAPLSAIHHNPASSDPHKGSIGVALDGTGGAEMVVVGGQDSSNHYIEQISVFNLRSLKWTATNSLGKSCGAYRSVVAPLTSFPVSEIGKRAPTKEENLGSTPPETGSSMLIYSNYNFLDVKLELQVRLPDGQLIEKPMYGNVTPPGLRFPNGGVIDGHFVVSGTYLTSSKQEYALWALDLRNLTWSRIDAGGSVFAQGSWNRGIPWSRRNTFVILGHRRRSLVEDYNHRRINFSHICMVELEAFGLYNNPRKNSSTSSYISMSAPALPNSLLSKMPVATGGGRPYSEAADELGQLALRMRELADMDILAIGGERVPVNSHLLARRWGPYFNQLLRDSANTPDGISDAATLRPNMNSQASRNSAVTITPSVGTTFSNATTLTNNKTDPLSNVEPPEPRNLPPTSRPRTLYVPHTHLTIQILVHYLYTSSLPPLGSHLCTPQILCSLLQLARPYQVDGLLEATVERLHQVLDGRNAAAVFNAAAMAAGGGRGTGFVSSAGTLDMLNANHNQQRSGDSNPASSEASSLSTSNPSDKPSAGRPGALRINTNFTGAARNEDRDGARSSASTSTSASFSATDSEYNNGESGFGRGMDGREREVWTGDVSSVVGLQKRGLRALMEGRRLRERGGAPGSQGRPATAVTQDGTRVGLGIV